MCVKIFISKYFDLFLNIFNFFSVKWQKQKNKIKEHNLNFQTNKYFFTVNMRTWRKNVLHSPCYAAFTLNKYSVTFSKHPSVQYLCLFRVTTTISLLIFKLHKKTNGLIGKIHHIFKTVQQLDCPTLAVRVLGQSDENAP